jgi:hypothetical protein
MTHDPDCYVPAARMRSHPSAQVRAHAGVADPRASLAVRYLAEVGERVFCSARPRVSLAPRARARGAPAPERTNVIGRLRVVARHEAIRLVRYDRRLTSSGAVRHYETGAERQSARLAAHAALVSVSALPARKVPFWRGRWRGIATARSPPSYA